MGKRGKSASQFVTGAFIGAAVGAVTALLFSPKTGNDFRSDLGKQTETVKERSGEWLTLAKQRSRSLAKSVSDQSSQVVDRIRDWQETTSTADSTDASLNHEPEVKQERPSIEIPKDYHFDEQADKKVDD